MFQRF